MNCVCGMNTASAGFVSRYRVSRVPKGQPQSAHLQRAKIHRDMIRMRRHLMIEGQRGYADTLKKYFKKMLGRICDKVEYRLHMSYGAAHRKADISFGSSESLWREAINEVLGTSANVELMADSLPAMQSVIAKSYARTSLFIGEEEAHDASVILLRRAQGMARMVTRINETTRNNLADTIRSAMEDGQTIVEIVRRVRDEIPDIEAARIPTIVRTEVGRAIDEGTKQALRESSSVTHVDVVGCMGVEPGIPEFDGRPTCNIVGVPVERLDELQFHINHTGCIVPSRYRTD
jgi:hypothetical protein